MKKITGYVLLLCLLLGLLLSANVVCANEESPVNIYNIKYISETQNEIADTMATGYSEVFETAVTKVRPEREGYEFMGWSYSPKDYNNTPLIQPGEKIKISSSLELYAIWRNLNVVKISYKDGPQEILPLQQANMGKVRISGIIPQKNGYIFAGWSYSDADGAKILIPGDEIEVSKNVVLISRWERGTLSLPTLELRTSEPDAAFFGCDNYEQFDSLELKVCSPETGFQDVYTLREGRVRINDLAYGAYEAQIVARKFGIEYRSNKINFVFTDGIEREGNALNVFMDGKLLEFDLPPTLISDHTFVTLRYFCEYLGADVRWDEVGRMAIITYNGTRMKIRENSDVCVVDGTVYQLPAPTVIMSGRMFIPLRSVAELCKCEVIWDPSRKVYMFSDKTNVFDKNLFSISGNDGKFMCVDGGEVGLAKETFFEAMWIFDTIDESRGYYEIYNFSDMTTPLEVKASEMTEGNTLRIHEKSGYDGYIWKVTKCGDGEYFIQPANNDKFYLDAANLCITTEVTKVYLNEIYR